MEDVYVAVQQFLAYHDPQEILPLTKDYPTAELAAALLRLATTRDETTRMRGRAVRSLAVLDALDADAWLAVLRTASAGLLKDWLVTWGDPTDTTVLNAEHIRAIFETINLPKSSSGLGRAILAFLQRGGNFTSAVYIPGAVYPFWQVKLDCVNSVIDLDDADSLRTLAAYSTMTYWKARRNIIEYIQRRLEENRLSEADRQIAAGILHQFITDGKSDEKTPTLRMGRELFARLTNPEDPVLQPYTTRVMAVLSDGGVIAGTAFLVGPGLALTCTHVVESAGRLPGQTLKLQLQNGQILAAIIDEAVWEQGQPADVALLRIAPELLSELGWLEVGPSASSIGRSFLSFGYPTMDEIIGLHAHGEILGLIKTDPGRVRVQLKSPELTTGFSGAPVWDEKAKSVVGMVSHVWLPDDDLKNRDTAFAVPGEVLLAFLT